MTTKKLTEHEQNFLNGKIDRLEHSASEKNLPKQTEGKLQLILVPRKIISAIAKVREYGNKKYNTKYPGNWQDNSKENYQDAAFRHFIAYLDDNESVDAESGLPHLHHLACNISFLIEGGFKK
jgi:hypothetical protein